MMAATGIESLFGNMYAKGEKELLNKTFSAIEFFVHTAVMIIFTIAAVSVVPFVMVYTRDITDTNYSEPVFGIILVVAYASQCLRIPYFRMIKAVGRFKETQNGAFISMGLNIVISIALIFPFGLVGIAIGTLIAMFFHTIYFVWYLRKHILHRTAFIFIKYLCSDAIIMVGSYLLTRFLDSNCLNYYEWILYALKCAGIVIGLCIVISALFHFREMKDGFTFIKKMRRVPTN